jgi:baculoviral IAP repeat-containing protein 7/8
MNEDLFITDLKRDEILGFVNAKLSCLEDTPRNHSPFVSAHERLKSFHVRPWKGLFTDLTRLADAGFYRSTKEEFSDNVPLDDKVFCAFCAVCMMRWEVNDDPVAVHRQYKPKCQFVSGEVIANVAITRDPFIPEWGGIKWYIDFRLQLRGAVDPKIDGIYVRTPRAHPKYHQLDERLKSFRNVWPLERTISSTLMASAGFLYGGVNDYVHCFECGIAFAGWKAGANPMATHSHFAKNCMFVRTSRPVSTGHVEALDCKICYRDAVSVLFLPCGHVVSCWRCSRGCKLCPVCRAVITFDVPAYLS